MRALKIEIIAEIKITIMNIWSAMTATFIPTWTIKESILLNIFVSVKLHWYLTSVRLDNIIVRVCYDQSSYFQSYFYIDNLLQDGVNSKFHFLNGNSPVLLYMKECEHLNEIADT